MRLADRGLLETSWQAGPEGRPPRHLYRMTSAGQAYVSEFAAASAVRTTARPRIGLSEA